MATTGIETQAPVEQAADAPDRELEEALAQVRSLVEEGRVKPALTLLKSMAERWPDAPRVQRWIYVLDVPPGRVLHGKPTINLDREHAWLKAHRHEYPGCWIAVKGDELMLADPELKNVHAAVRDRLGDEGAVIWFEMKPLE